MASHREAAFEYAMKVVASSDPKHADLPPQLDGTTREHATREVQIGPHRVDVDEEIATLVELLVGAGLCTLASCQGNPGANGYLSFYSPEQGGIQFKEILKETGITFDVISKPLYYSLSRDVAPTNECPLEPSIMLPQCVFTFANADIPKITEAAQRRWS